MITRIDLPATLLAAALLAASSSVYAAPNYCGDGKKKGNEQCDGSDFGKLDCRDFGFQAGALTCNADCTIDTSKCNHCGDGVRQDPEECDDLDLAGKSCTDFGYTGGQLACWQLCTFDTSNCTNDAPPSPPPPPALPPIDSLELPPDELDVFKVQGSVSQNAPRVTILIDNSSSMHSNSSAFWNCPWFSANHGNGKKRLHWVQAVLIGCESPNDGLLDILGSEVLFSIRETRPLGPEPLGEFGSSIPALEQAVLSVGNTSNPAKTEALEKAGRHYDEYFNKANAGCGQHYIIDIGRGHTGGSDATFTSACNGDTLFVHRKEPEYGSGYLYEHDLLCDVPGFQNITTYTVGLEPNAPGVESMQAIARMGGGEYFEANDVASLRVALVSILSLIASRSFATSASYTVQRTPELFTGNVAYTDAYSPQASGQWYGNVKKSCLFPKYVGGLYDTTNRDCLFKSPDGYNLLTNPDAIDQWTGTSGPDTTTGGAGTLLRKRMANPGSSTPKTPYRPRDIVSWWPGSKYLPITDSAWSDLHFWVVNERFDAFKNRVHGYTFEADAYGNPVEVPEWVLGETIHPEVTLLKYADDCDVAGACYLVMAGNDGMLHFFDAANGEETQGLVPFELLNPLYGITRHKLADLDEQPNMKGLHSYYIDGSMKVFHHEKDGDGAIDPDETAYLIVGLGRGGHAYYKIPLEKFKGKVDANTPIYPLVQTRSNQAYSQLQETWAAPWLGRANVDGKVRNLAIFPTGHVPQFDRPDAKVPDLIPGPTEYWSIVDSCANVAAASGMNPNICNQWYPGGYPDIGVHVKVGPFKIPNENTVAWQFHFAAMDLDTNDRLYVEDGSGFGANAVTGTGQASESWSFNIPQNGWSNWVFDDSAYVHWSMDANETSNKGFQIANVHRIEERAGPIGPHYPGIYVVDLDIWSGAPAFGSGMSNSSGLVIQIAKRCTDNPKTCIDENESPDLKYMTCPITGEVAVYQQSSRIRGMYFGDECGQLWKVAPKGSGSDFEVKRLLNLNNADFSSQSNPQGISKDFRKIFRRLDLVLSTCSGANSIGIYFGTGNTQRPNATDELENPGLNSGRDVIGVFWDDGDSYDKTIADLEDITAVNKIDPKKIRTLGKVGWYIELDEDEKMLRDPLVFLGTAYFKVHAPSASSLTCGNTIGADYIYAVDSCTGEAVADFDGDGVRDVDDRKAWEGNHDIGGNLLLFTPREGDSFVSAGSQTVEESGAINPKKIPSIQLYDWRMPRGYER